MLNHTQTGLRGDTRDHTPVRVLRKGADNSLYNVNLSGAFLWVNPHNQKDPPE